MTASIRCNGLAKAKAALRPGGVLADLVRRARRPPSPAASASAGFKVDDVTVRARSNGKGPRHTIWFASSR